MNTPTPKLPPLSAKVGTESEVMPTRTTAGNINRGTTAMNNVALGGANTNNIPSVKVVRPKYSRVSGKKVVAPKAKYSRTTVSKVQSEADAGDMSHYNPNLD